LVSPKERVKPKGIFCSIVSEKKKPLSGVHLVAGSDAHRRHPPQRGWEKL